MVEHRFAKREDFLRFYGHVPGTTRAIVLLKDGDPIALGGIAYERTVVKMYMDLREEARRYPVAMMKAAKTMMQYAQESHRLLLAVRDPCESADRFLRHFGFEPYLDSNNGVVYRWLPPLHP